MDEQHDRIEVIDRDGWNKAYPINKSIFHIGSDPRNDIILNNWHGSGISPRHIQLLRMAGSGTGYRLVNLGQSNVTLNGSEGHPRSEVVAPQAAVDLEEGERIRLGDFTLIFKTTSMGGHGISEEASSPSMGLQFFLPQNRLVPDRPLNGTLLVRNRGYRDAVQFRLEVIGLGAESYELGPAPILFPEAEREVFITLVHTKAPQPLAGDHRVTIRATAPDDYPGESVAVSQVVRVMPYHNHALRLMNEAS